MVCNDNSHCEEPEPEPEPLRELYEAEEGDEERGGAGREGGREGGGA